MSKIISASIDLSKVNKSRIIEGKNGAKYYNITIIVNDEQDKYGKDCSITEGQTKEEREAKQPRVFIGNGKVIYSSDLKTSKPAEQQKQESDLPF